MRLYSKIRFCLSRFRLCDIDIFISMCLYFIKKKYMFLFCRTASKMKRETVSYILLHLTSCILHLASTCTCNLCTCNLRLHVHSCTRAHVHSFGVQWCAKVCNGVQRCALVACAHRCTTQRVLRGCYA